MSFCPGTSPSSLKETNERGVGTVPRHSSRLAREHVMTRSFTTARLSVDPRSRRPTCRSWSGSGPIREWSGCSAALGVSNRSSGCSMTRSGTGRCMGSGDGLSVALAYRWEPSSSLPAMCSAVTRWNWGMRWCPAPGATATPRRLAMVHCLSDECGRVVRGRCLRVEVQCGVFGRDGASWLHPPGANRSSAGSALAVPQDPGRRSPGGMTPGDRVDYRLVRLSSSVPMVSLPG
jgi:hypothetical protein